jgi:hypothetical protein
VNRSRYRKLWLALVAAALADAAVHRRRHGKLLGVVPYDFRTPSLDRFGGRLWNPEGPLLPPSLFGVGWTLNVGRLARLAGLA